MTDEQQKQLTNFETRVRHLMMLCETLQKENVQMAKTLDGQEAALNKAKENIRELTTKYENLKLAKFLSRDQNDVKKAQRRVSGLVRDIDRCIALINE
jgi:archaellum component FlaC